MEKLDLINEHHKAGGIDTSIFETMRAEIMEQLEILQA